MWRLGIWGNGHFGANGLFKTDEHWGKGANGHLRKMNTRKYALQGEWVWGACGDWGKWTFKEMGTLGPMSIGANGHRGQMGTLETMGIGASEHYWGRIGTLGQMGSRKNEHLGKWAFGENVHFGGNKYLGHWGTLTSRHLEK